MSTTSQNQAAASGDYVIQITPESARFIRQTLNAFLQSTECARVALIECSGALIVSEAREGMKPFDESAGILATGSFSSMQMMATRMGEPEPPEILCHGVKQNLYLIPVTEEYFLMTGFQPGLAVGLVRLHARQASAQLIEELAGMRSFMPTGPIAALPREPEDSQEKGPFSEYA